MKPQQGAWLLLLALLRFFLSVNAGQPPGATFSNVSYGPHPRNVFDFWKATGTGPRPLLVYIHGGGWTTGDKGQKTPEFQRFLEKGISCAAINYRLTPDNPLPAPVHDAARAIQFIRSKEVAWNVDASHIALTGPSAGACTSMWLLLHDDLADPSALDPVLRQSSRVCAAAVDVGQTSIDPKVIEGWLGPKVLDHRMIFMAVGKTNMQAALEHYDQHRGLYTEFSPINHVDAKDPPLFMTCNGDVSLPARDGGHGIHHPLFGIKLKEKSDKVGHECYLLVPGLYQSERYPNSEVFLMDKLLKTPAARVKSPACRNGLWNGQPDAKTESSQTGKKLDHIAQLAKTQAAGDFLGHGGK